MIDVDASEAARSFGERLCGAWWPRFKPWLANHMHDPVLAIEAAFMDGVRATLKLVNDESQLLQIIGEEPCAPPIPNPSRAPSSASALPKRPRRRPDFSKCP